MSQTDEDVTRQTLLRICSSKTIAHGTYIVTIAIGAFALIQIAISIKPLLFLHVCAISCALSVLISLLLVMTFNLLYWGMMEYAITYVCPTEKEKIPEWLKKFVQEGKARPTVTVRLLDAAHNLVINRRKRISYFAGRWLFDRETRLRLFALWLGMFLAILSIFLA